MPDNSQKFQAYANPARFMALSATLLPLFSTVATVLLSVGIYLALFVSPADYQQGESVRIMYVHVPSAWLAMLGYGVLAVASAISLVFRHPLADVAGRAAAPIGACFALLALVTGSLWGKPMWGTWWVWDARLTSMLILFFLYLGYIALWSTLEEPQRASRVAAVLALVGSINLPIIHYSVVWWNTLHQPSSVFRLGGPTIAASMLLPLLTMALGFTVFFSALLLLRMRAEILRRRLRLLLLLRAEP